MAYIEIKYVPREQLQVITHQEVTRYVGGSFQAAIYGLMDEEQQRCTVVAVPYDRTKLQSGVIVMAHSEGDWFVIAEDTTDKPLVEALLVNAGVPLAQIIRTYAGEKVPARTDV